MHGSGVGVQPARDETGSKKLCQSQGLGQVAVNQGGGPVLAGHQDLKQSSALFAGKLVHRVEIDARVGQGIGECRRPQPAEAIARLRVSGTFQVPRDGTRRCAQDQSMAHTVDGIGKISRWIEGRYGSPGDFVRD